MKLTNKVKAVKEEKSYGHLTLNSAEIPAVKNLKIGAEQELTIKVKVKGLRQPDRWEISDGNAKPKDIIASVSILSIEHKESMKEEKVEE